MRYALVSLGTLLTLLAPPVRAQDRPKVLSIESDALLKVPESLTGSRAFVVAEHPPKVEVTIFSDLPQKGPQTLWSSWGDGCLASDGLYYTSIGDHLGRDATSYLYAYNPQTRELRRVVDVARDLALKPGQYGHGKIHSGIHEARDGWLYFSTYWGKHREVADAFGPDYRGSLLLRYLPKRDQLENLGAIVPEHGLPASHFDPERGLLYFHVVYDGGIAVYDIGQQALKFLGGQEHKAGDRAFLSDNRGRVYFSASDGTLRYYDPETNRIHTTDARLPGPDRAAVLRAASQPAPDGLVYGLTDHGGLFSFDPETRSIRDLGPNFLDGDYTATLELSPDGRFLYFAPGSHGSGAQSGTPIVQYEIASGRRKVLAFLNQPLRNRLEYHIGGTYNLAVSPSGDRLFFTFNGAPLAAAGSKKQPTFGLPSLVVLHIPESER